MAMLVSIYLYNTVYTEREEGRRHVFSLCVYMLCRVEQIRRKSEEEDDVAAKDITLSLGRDSVRILSSHYIGLSLTPIYSYSHPCFMYTRI